MGTHKTGQVPVGAYVDLKSRDYLDTLVEERGLLSRSDAVRIVIDEHKSVIYNRINRNTALTPKDVVANDNILTKV